MGTDLLTELRAAGITFSVDGGNLVATPKAAITDELRSLIRTHKAELLAALARPDRLPPVPSGLGSAELLDQILGGYGTPPGVPPLADCALARQIRSMPEDDHVPAEDLDDTAADADAAVWWRVGITEPGGRTVEVDTPSGCTLPDWQAYAQRYHGPGCALAPIAGMPKLRAPVNLDEAIRAACAGLEGISPELFHSLLSPEDVADIEAGAIPVETLHTSALSFSGRIVAR